MGGLRDVCAGSPLADKWIIAPSRRAGQQWLDTIARSGQPVLNARVVTLQHMALDLASFEMNERGVRFLRGPEVELASYHIFDLLSGQGAAYLSPLVPGPGLIGKLTRTLQDLRLAGLSPRSLDPTQFEVPGKCADLAALLGFYEQELTAGMLADYADVLAMATQRLRSGSAWPSDALLIAPVDLTERLHGLERIFWEAIPEEKRIVLEVDHAGDVPADSALLAWIGDPRNAPSARGDGTARIFRAVGEINEVREVFRECGEKGISFDQVELLYTDSDTYLPILYEAASTYSDDPDDPFPVTFLEGIPVKYSRPGRALIGWLDWVAEGYAQPTLVRMIKDGLLDIKQLDIAQWSFQRLGAMLAALPIGKGRARFTTELNRKVGSLAKRSGEQTEAHARAEAQLPAWIALRTLADQLLKCAPDTGDSPDALIGKVADFLRTCSRSLNQFDAYSSQRMLDDIEELRSCLVKNPVNLDAAQWLRGLALSTKVGGQGPRPGSIFAAPLHAGGFSGRSHTFIIGLDDSRFPGTGRQDPLMLDGERRRISKELPSGVERLSETSVDLTRLLARLRGNITLGYCCRSLTDDRELFPTPALLSAFRILSGNREAQLADFLAGLPEMASFAPPDPRHCASVGEWWLWRTCTAGPLADIGAVVSEHFPHLGRGLEAKRARASDRFTEYDGWVAEAGPDCDPSSPEAPALSATRLELLGKNPMEYFFQYVLGIKIPEEYQLDPSVWLDPSQQGELLHEVFRLFIVGCIQECRTPDFDRDKESLNNSLAAQVDAWTRKVPPLSRDVFERQVREMRRTADIFLRDAEQHSLESTPLCCETVIGWSTPQEKTFLSRKEPVFLELPDGRAIRVRGRIDRVDELRGGEDLLTVWDYKTGRGLRDKESDPFRGGRRLQNLLYYMMVASLLAEERPGARLVSFGYLFVHPRHFARRVVWTWSPEELTEGRRLLGFLCSMASSGCFPCSTDKDDLKYSDYAPALGSTTAAVEDSKRKLGNPENEMLGPWRELRG